jgi:hypothetical protein
MSEVDGEPLDLDADPTLGGGGSETGVVDEATDVVSGEGALA